MQDSFFERDWRSVDEAVLRIESTTDLAALQEVSLKCIRALVPSTQVVFFISYTNDRNQLCDPVVMGAEAKFMPEFLRGTFNCDEDSELFFSGKHIFNHITETTRDSDQIPEEYLVGTKVYQEMYIPQGIHYAMRSSLIYKRRFVGTIELFNSKEKGDFTDKQLKTFAILAPHIANHLGLLMQVKEDGESSPTFNASEVRDRYGLTGREIEIVSLIAAGKSDAQIVDKLCISESTFKKHLYNAYHKMDISSRSQLYNTLLRG